MSLSLIIMAAGAGSRFGGDKPMAGVGPKGQSLFEYSVYDAFKAGFKHVVFVVNAQQDTSDFSTRLQHYGDELKVDFVVQSLSAYVDSDNAGQASVTARSKPWGTAHAVLVCRELIHSPFVVINADDYYGQENFALIAAYLLANSEDPKTCVLPGYRLENTLSDSGGVNRGVCGVDADGYLESIREVRGITVDASMTVTVDQSDRHIAINTLSIVSMTLWGFVPALFDSLAREFQVFLNETPNIELDEFYLPETVNVVIKRKALRVKVLETSEKWKGVTYAADLPDVRDYMSKLTDEGRYKGLGRR